MPNLDTEKKLANFTDAMLNMAIEQSHDIVVELSDKEKDLVAKAKKDIAAEVERYKNKKLTEIKARESHRITTRMTENKRTLLQFREDCAKLAFSEAREKIRQFTESEGYLPHLKGLLKKSVSVFGYGFAAVVYLRPEDMRFADELHASAAGVSLAFSEGGFTLGGLCLSCPAMGKQVDLTFDSAMADMVGHFADMSGLKVGE